MIRAITANSQPLSKPVNFGNNEDSNTDKAKTALGTGALAVVGYGVTKKGVPALKNLVTNSKIVGFLSKQCDKAKGSIASRIKPDSLIGKSLDNVSGLFENLKNIGRDFIKSVENNLELKADSFKNASGEAISVGIGAGAATLLQPILGDFITEKEEDSAD